jgi:phage shock protein PspC (stress-responsive transcriptional regulator)
MGRQTRQRRVTDEAGRRASQAFSQAERAVRAASSEVKKQTSKTRSSMRSRSERAGRRLTKKRSARKISGVAAGIADYFGLDPTIVRIAFVIGTMASQGAALLLYIILAFALPDEDARDRDDDPVIQIIDD